MPPGLADPFLDILKYVKGGKFLVITTPSRLSINIVKKTLTILKEQDLKVLGLIENMCLPESKGLLYGLSEAYKVKYLGSVPFYRGLEEHLDTLKNFMSTEFFRKMVSLSEILVKE
jgi:ATP-binding protein involved in chromosome partitioning